MRKRLAPVLGQRRRFAGAVEQRHANGCLEALYPPRHGRLGQVELGGGTVDGAGFRHSNKGPEIAKVHRPLALMSFGNNDVTEYVNAAAGDKMTVKPYRPNVGIALFNAQGRVLIGHRFRDDGPEIILPGLEWQMPQGGVDEGEDLRAAAFRELWEETGASRAD